MKYSICLLLCSILQTSSITRIENRGKQARPPRRLFLRNRHRLRRTEILRVVGCCATIATYNGWIVGKRFNTVIFTFRLKRAHMHFVRFDITCHDIPPYTDLVIRSPIGFQANFIKFFYLGNLLSTDFSIKTGGGISPVALLHLLPDTNLPARHMAT